MTRVVLELRGRHLKTLDSCCRDKLTILNLCITLQCRIFELVIIRLHSNNFIIVLKSSSYVFNALTPKKYIFPFSWSELVGPVKFGSPKSVESFRQQLARLTQSTC